MSILIELNRRLETLYTPEVIHMAFEATVRNFVYLVEEGVRGMLRVTREGVRRESLAGYALPREDGAPDWVPQIVPIFSLSLSDKGFR